MIEQRSVADIQPGTRVRWMGEEWTVVVIHQHPRFGHFFNVTNDRDGRLPAAALGVGQAAWLQLGAVGFARPGGDQPPAVSFSLRFLDEAGKPTQAKPIEVPALKGLSPGQTLVPVQFLLSPNRPGKFTAEITATDEVGKKTATLSVPLTVVEAK